MLMMLMLCGCCDGDADVDKDDTKLLIDGRSSTNRRRQTNGDSEIVMNSK